MFASVGIFVMLVGYATLFLCINLLHWNPSVSYAVQTVVSVGLNFVLNYSITWRDRREKSVWRQLGRFLTARVVTIPLNQVLFNVFIALGIAYPIANTGCIIITMVYSYFVADRWTHGTLRLRDIAGAMRGRFLRRGRSKRAHNSRTQLKSVDTKMPQADDFGLDFRAEPRRFTVVIPTKQNTGSIADTVTALLLQDYPFPPEIIVVGDTADTAWGHLAEFGNRIIRIELRVTSPGRDSNAKRMAGLKRASRASEILAVMDDDVIPPRTWMRQANELLQGYIQAVAGPVTGLGSSFWQRYIDDNPVARKMPETGMSYVLSKRTIQRYKPAVTANFVVTRKLFEVAGGPDPAFTNSYEDYSWMRVIIEAGYPILCTAKLTCSRYHREGLRPLMREYLRSGKGCADYIRVFGSRCAFAQKRLQQLRTFYGAVAAGILLAVFEPFATVLGGGIAALLLITAVAIRTQSREALTYPFLTLLLGTMFVVGLTRQLVTSRGVVAPIIHGVRILRHETSEGTAVA